MKRKPRTSFLDTLEAAQRLAFAPFIFQAAAAALRFGFLEAVNRHPGATPAEIARDIAITPYAAGVIADLLVPAGVLDRVPAKGEKGERSTGLALSSVGDLLLFDEMTRANFFFTESVCYQGLGKTAESLAEGRPAGLSAFDPSWKTIYPHLPELPEEAQKAWFGFDHWHSDRAYEAALEILAEACAPTGPRKLVDIGGNTGRFSREFLLRFPASTAVLVDLPVEVELLPSRPGIADVKDRLEGASIDWLTDDELTDRPAVADADIFWMSQFLDCFSEAEAVSILERTRRAMAPGARLAVLEPIVSEQRHRAAELSLAATNLYFTVLANGNSRFFNGEDLRRIFREAGFRIESETPDLGVSHTLFLLVPEA
ncbi:methyltransferase [Sutterella sp.]|uniref:methyltransferase n=1 Tax=Sutterella sp. TaxID=1981025 RepID=UPI0026E056C2|nr:methyltransferase [Sutterella sp.]MDO5530943.1 methyltransferase [Sutterella sp.]